MFIDITTAFVKPSLNPAPTSPIYVNALDGAIVSVNGRWATGLRNFTLRLRCTSIAGAYVERFELRNILNAVMETTPLTPIEFWAIPAGTTDFFFQPLFSSPNDLLSLYFHATPSEPAGFGEFTFTIAIQSLFWKDFISSFETDS